MASGRDGASALGSKWVILPQHFDKLSTCLAFCVSPGRAFAVGPALHGLGEETKGEKDPEKEFRMTVEVGVLCCIARFPFLREGVRGWVDVLATKSLDDARSQTPRPGLTPKPLFMCIDLFGWSFVLLIVVVLQLSEPLWRSG